LGGVYFVSAPAEASNMGFKLERSFTVQPNLRNFYFVSFPLFNGLSDIASDDVAFGEDPCVGTPGDGEINATDAICDLWTSRDGAGVGAGFTISKLNTSTCLYDSRTGTKTGANSWFYVGAFTDPIGEGINREVGYFINVGKAPGDPDLENRAVIVGSHDPSFLGHNVSSAGGCSADIISLSYHTMYRTVDEIICGLEGVDWIPNPGPENDNPTNPDGSGDAWCPNGIFDPLGGAGKGITVSTFDNDPGSAGANLYVPRTALNTGPGQIGFFGTNYNLQPGEAYLVAIADDVADRVFNSPHF
jgi:hypothetical protein